MQKTWIISLALVLAPLVLRAANYSQCSTQTPLISAPEIGSLLAELPGNFHKVDNSIYRGARIENQSQATALLKLGIKTVINLQGGDLYSRAGEEVLGNDWSVLLPIVEPGETPAEIAQEGLELQLAGLSPRNYFSIPIDSLSLVHPKEEGRIEQILKILNDPKTPRPIFIHCAHGADRTGLMVALYRVLTENICMNTAHAEWTALGHDNLHTAITGALDLFYYQYLMEKIYLGSN